MERLCKLSWITEIASPNQNLSPVTPQFIMLLGLYLLIYSSFLVNPIFSMFVLLSSPTQNVKVPSIFNFHKFPAFSAGQNGVGLNGVILVT